MWKYKIISIINYDCAYRPSPQNINIIIFCCGIICLGRCSIHQYYNTWRSFGLTILYEYRIHKLNSNWNTISLRGFLFRVLMMHGSEIVTRTQAYFCCLDASIRLLLLFKNVATTYSNIWKILANGVSERITWITH